MRQCTRISIVLSCALSGLCTLRTLPTDYSPAHCTIGEASPPALTTCPPHVLAASAASLPPWMEERRR